MAEATPRAHGGSSGSGSSGSGGSVQVRLARALDDVLAIDRLLDRYEATRDAADLRQVTRDMRSMAQQLKDLGGDENCRTRENAPLLQELSGKMRELVSRTKSVSQTRSSQSQLGSSTQQATQVAKNSSGPHEVTPVSGDRSDPSTSAGLQAGVSAIISSKPLSSEQASFGGGGRGSGRLSVAGEGNGARVPPPRLRGWLRKQGEDILRAWKTRYFLQSDDGAVLFYYAKEEDRAADLSPLGQINMREASEVLPGGKGLFNLQMTTGRTYHLCVVEKGDALSVEQGRWIKGLEVWIRWFTREHALDQLRVDNGSGGSENAALLTGGGRARGRSEAFSANRPELAAAAAIQKAASDGRVEEAREAGVKAEADAQARVEAEAQARAEAEARAKADATARAEAEAKADAAVRAVAEAEDRARAEAEARAEARAREKEEARQMEVVCAAANKEEMPEAETEVKFEPGVREEARQRDAVGAAVETGAKSEGDPREDETRVANLVSKVGEVDTKARVEADARPKADFKIETAGVRASPKLSMGISAEGTLLSERLAAEAKAKAHEQADTIARRAAEERARVEASIEQERQQASTLAKPQLQKPESVVFERKNPRVEKRREKQKAQRAAAEHARAREEEHRREGERIVAEQEAADEAELKHELEKRVISLQRGDKDADSAANASDGSNGGSDGGAHVIRDISAQLMRVEELALGLQGQLTAKEAAEEVAIVRASRAEQRVKQLEDDVRAKDETIRQLSATRGRRSGSVGDRSRSYASMGNMNFQMSQQLSAELDSRAQDVERLQEAAWAHQRHSAHLVDQLQGAEERCASIVKAEEAARQRMVQKMRDSMEGLQRVREKYLLQQMSLLETSENQASLVAELLMLKKEYFFSLALSLKLSLFGGNCNVDVMELFEQAIAEDVPWSQWPVWLPRQMEEGGF